MGLFRDLAKHPAPSRFILWEFLPFRTMGGVARAGDRMSMAKRKTHLESVPLSPKAEAFCREYLVDRNATFAARRAGYAEKTANRTGHNLLKDPRVQARVAKAGEIAEKRFEVTAERVIEEIAKVGFASMRQFVRIDAEGQPRIDLSETPEWALDALAEVKTETVIEGGAGEGEGQVVRKTQIKLHDKLKALAHLGEITGAFNGAKQETANAFANAFMQLLSNGSKAPIRSLAPARRADG